MKIEFKTDNDAFYDDKHYACYQILVDISEKVIEGTESGTIKDINGNKIGQWDLNG